MSAAFECDDDDDCGDGSDEDETKCSRKFQMSVCTVEECVLQTCSKRVTWV